MKKAFFNSLKGQGQEYDKEKGKRKDKSRARARARAYFWLKFVGFLVLFLEQNNQKKFLHTNKLINFNQ